MKTKQAFLAINIDDEMNRRIQTVATKLKLKKNTLARMAIEAAVESIEGSGKLVLPLTFICRHECGKQEPPPVPESAPVYCNKKSKPKKNDP